MKRWLKPLQVRVDVIAHRLLEVDDRRGLDPSPDDVERHLGHAQRITAPPRALLGGIPELLLTEIPSGSTCCGSAGIYNLVQPGPARELGERKADAVASTGARLLIAANPGCTLQITAALADRGQVLPVAHLAEVLDASLRGVPVGRLLGSQAR